MSVLPLLATGTGVDAEITTVEEVRRRAYLAGDYTAVASVLAGDFFLIKLTRVSAAP